MSRRQSGDRGISILEVSIVSFILLTVSAAIGTIVVSAVRTARVAEQQSASVDEGRIAQAQILRDLRGATVVGSCSRAGPPAVPAGYCLDVIYQTPAGAQDQVEYQAVQPEAGGSTVLKRYSGCDASFDNCASVRTLTSSLANVAQSTPVFSCLSTTTLPHIQVTLIVTPLAARTGGSLTLQTTARPRNVGAASALC